MIVDGDKMRPVGFGTCISSQVKNIHILHRNTKI
jgi:hypothetical protein